MTSCIARLTSIPAELLKLPKLAWLVSKTQCASVCACVRVRAGFIVAAVDLESKKVTASNFATV